MKEKRKTVRELAQARCDRARRKVPYLTFFIGDGPCATCVAAARAARKRDDRSK